MQPSNIKPTIGQLVTVELGLLGVNATVENQDVVSINLLNNCTLECGTANEYWGCDLVESHGDVRQSFTLSVRSDDQRRPSLIAREIANLIYRLDQAQQVIGERWMVQADPEHAGEHLNHDYRFITTEGFDFRNVSTKGVVVCAMRDLPSIREVASHIVATHNASIAKTYCSHGETSQETRLLETVTDIAYIAGGKEYYSGDSRADITQFIEWAREFENLRVVDGKTCEESFNGKDYMTAVEEFALAKLNEAGNTKTLTLFERITSELCARGWDASSNAGIVSVRTQPTAVSNFEKGEAYWRASHYSHGKMTMSDELSLLVMTDDAIKIVDAFEWAMNGGRK